MKNKYTQIIVGLLAIGLTAGCETHKHHKILESEATVSKAQAEQTALAKVPGGTIKEGELEKEKGHLIWSFDIAQPGTSDIKEVQVDAKTGQILSVETETAKQEAKEGKKEKKKDEDDEKEEKK
jgi:hypothetical protein